MLRGTLKNLIEGQSDQSAIFKGDSIAESVLDVRLSLADYRGTTFDTLVDDGGFLSIYEVARPEMAASSAIVGRIISMIDFASEKSNEAVAAREAVLKQTAEFSQNNFQKSHIFADEKMEEGLRFATDEILYVSRFEGKFPPVLNGLSAVSTGLMGGTRVALSVGWRAVEKVRIGDEILTFDSGLKPIRAIHEGHARGGDIILHFPKGLIGNRESFSCFSSELILVESNVAESELGDPFQLVEAMNFSKFAGVRVEEVQRDVDIPFFYIELDEPQVIFSSSGALVGVNSRFPNENDYAVLNDESLLEMILDELSEKWAMYVTDNFQGVGRQELSSS